MYEELINAIRQSACKEDCGMCPKKKLPCSDRFSRQAADAIEELSRENKSLAASVEEAAEILRNRKPRWIPVTERLPEVNKQVLVYAGFFQPYIEVSYYCGEWRFAYDDTEVPAVYYWMTLPEPPKEET